MNMNPIDQNLKNDIVLSLLETPFSRRTLHEKIEVMEAGRPTDPVDITQRRVDKNQKSYPINFQPAWLSNTKWLCTSTNTRALYCWPCLLFGRKGQSVWNESGFQDFLNTTRGITRHQSSKDHLGCCLDLNEFKTNQSSIIDAIRASEKSHKNMHNENATKNRKIIEIACKTTVLLSKLELSFRGHDENHNSLNRGNFKEFFSEFMKCQSIEIKTHYEKNKKIFSCDSKTVQNDLIEVLTDMLHSKIRDEIVESEFFSIQMDETTDIRQKAQSSIIIRYVNKGHVRERFLGFFDVSGDKTANGLFNLLDSVLKPLDYKNKLVGQCYDGASVMSGHLNGLQQKVKEVCPQAVFIHCLAHRLNLVLQNCLKHISSCRIFFSNLHGIPTYFHQSSKRTMVLTTSGVSVPTVAETRWSSNSKLITVVVEDWLKLKKTFESIRDSPDSDEGSRRQASGFAHLFEQFEFTFLAVVFNDIFTLTDILYQILQSRSLEINYCLREIEKTEALLREKRQDSVFDLLFSKATSLTDPVQKRGEIESEIRKKYRVFYFEILDTICIDFQTRFGDGQKLKFITLIDPKKFPQYQKNFPNGEFDQLFSQYHMIFKKQQRLKSELELLYSKQTTIQPSEILLNLDQEVFHETYKLFCLVFTLPSTSVSVERSFSCLKRLKTYLRNSISQERLTELAKISIEKELLHSLMTNEGEELFYKTMVDNYATKKGRRKELTYMQ